MKKKENKDHHLTKTEKLLEAGSPLNEVYRLLVQEEHVDMQKTWW
jgi:hypothetical protein